PAFWSPNRIVFHVEPGREIQINQNPGSWWRVNGRIAFPRWRCAEWREPFVARADARGRVELRIEPRGRVLGLGLHGAGVALVLMSLASARWLARAPAGHSGPAT